MRVLADHSTCELMDSKKRLGSELRAALYLYNEEKFIISSIAAIVEYGEPVVLEVGVTDEILGLSVCNKLLEFKPKCDRDLSKMRLEDWAAYKASGATSGRSFEQKSIYISVATVNSAINIEAAPRVTNEQTIRALCSISNGRTHAEIGAAVRKAVVAAKALRNAGVL